MKISLLVPLVALGLGCHAAAESPARPLTLAEARAAALQKHPKIGVAELLALAGRQVANQARSGFFPTVTVNLAGVETSSETDVRSASVGLPVSTIVERGGAAVFINQLITDFGRTYNLTASAQARAKAQEENVVATKLQILLEVDQAYFSALRAQAVGRVARVTLKERQLVEKQVSALEENALRSPLDVSFARVNLQQAQLLLSRAENDLQSAYATLAALLDEPETTAYRLTDDPAMEKPVSEVSPLLAEAYRHRPDLARLRFELEGARRFAKAEGALSYPTVSAQATGGELPYHDAATNNSYGAAGFIVNVPILTGGLNTARRKEAELRAHAAEETLHDANNGVARDVRIAWLTANNAYKNLAITDSLRDQAHKSLDLAQARFDVGTSGIVELSLAQVAYTSAEIDATNARYEYFLRRSILNYQVGHFP